VTIEDDAVVLAVEYEQPGQEEWIVELVSNKPLSEPITA
jgi:hypothetical protein